MTKYSEEMILRSHSGYCMPFEEAEGKNVEVTLFYGNQKHPVTGKTFWHDGIDFSASRYMLYAVADGTVSGVGSDAGRGIYQTIRYGKYEVTYRHLANVFVNFGETVKAGNVVSLSGDLMHMEVRFDGELMDPIDFITMLYGNVKALEQRNADGMPQFDSFEMTIPTRYDKDQKEIERLMLRWLPSYMEALYRHLYHPRKNGAEPEKYPHLGRDEELLLRDHAKHQQSARYRSALYAHGRQGTDAAHR